MTGKLKDVEKTAEEDLTNGIAEEGGRETPEKGKEEKDDTGTWRERWRKYARERK